MDLRQSAIIEPDRNTAYVVPAIAVSLFVFAYSTQFGAISILVFYGLWLGPLMLAPRVLLVHPAGVLALLTVPAIFVASTAWSDAAGTTLRAGIQYGVTFTCGMIAARIVSGANLMLGGTVGSLMVLIYSAMMGGYSYDYIDGTYAFNGAFSSKNQMGYYASLAILFSSSLFWAFRSPPRLLPLALATLVLGLVLLVMSDSATSLLSGFAAISAVLAMRLVLGLAPGLRFAAVLFIVSAAMVAGLAAWWGGAFDALFAAFGSDSTLTGRTYLWNRALEFGRESPLLGTGYNAFWVRGRPEAEALWETFYITARTGFHFHNLLIEAYVALGALGLVVTGALCLLLFTLPLVVALGPGNGGTLLVFTALCMMFLTRSVAEVDFITPHTAGTFLVAFVLLSLIDRRRTAYDATRLSRPSYVSSHGVAA
ncbi:O-antigen ligase family protein [Aestuariibius sp. 2305UL40-4]|uniref:O-antigen ligase family protein n=1 Tax=Aestuariibius violaceus TaxID=3234132 RepID=UPI00345E1E3C